MEYESCSSDSEIIETHFIDGPLGVTLRRRLEDGIVFVYDIVPNSQAINLDVQPNDELWAVGDSVLGLTPLDKQAWKGLIDFIKSCPRPLKMYWRRKFINANVEISYNNYSNITDIPTTEDVVNISKDSDNIVNRSSKSSNSKSSNYIEEINEDEEIKPSNSHTSITPPSNDIANTSNDVSIKSITEDNKQEDDDDIGQGGTIVKDNENEIINNNNLNKLKELSKILYFKEKEKSNIVTSFMSRVVGQIDIKEKGIETIDLVKEGRSFIRMSDIDVCIYKPNNNKNNNTTTRKTIILLSDILIIATPMENNLFQIEKTINLQIIKIKNYLLTPLDNNNQALLEMITPNYNVILYYLNDDIKNIWLESFELIIKNNNRSNNDILGWKHQYILGSLHSAVILRDIPLVEDIIKGFQSGILNYNLLDEIDDDGYTPLHYACILRLQQCIKLLVDAIANVDIPDKKGLTCVHWSALNLDYQALELLIPRTSDINMRDYDDRTPLFLTLIYGKDNKNNYNLPNVLKCSELLLNSFADGNICDHDGHTLLHYLASSWSINCIELLLNYSIEIVVLDYSNYMPALHYACQGISLRNKINNQIDDNVINREYAIATLRLLLQSGSRPNFKSKSNKTPLHMLIENELIWNEMLLYAILTLLSYGARIDLLDIQLINYIKTKFNEIEINSVIETRLALPPIDADSVNISTFEASRDQIAMQFLHESPNTNKSKSDKIIPSCLLCSVAFSLFKRQHHCRLCNVLCCDDCSKRRVILNGSQVRSCDPCYNRVQYLIDKKIKQSTNNLKSSDKLTNNNTSTTLDKNKSELFGSNNNSLNTTTKSNSTMESTTNQLGEAKDRLIERGEKLSKLSDRTADLSNQANEFARLAKQLQEQQKSSWF